MVYWVTHLFILLSFPSIFVLDWCGLEVVRATLFEWLRLNHGLQQRSFKVVSIFVRYEGTIEDAKIVFLLLAQEPKVSNRATCWNLVPTVCDCLLRLDPAAATTISSWVLIVLVIPETKSVISAFNTGCLLFLPWICLESIPYWIERSLRIIIFTMFSNETLQSWAFQAIFSSINVLQRDATSFLAAWYSFQAIFSLSSTTREVT